MNAQNVITILKKELYETLRDKRTLIAMIGVPLVLYPLLILVVGQAAVMQRGKLERAESRVALVGAETERLRPWLEGAEKVTLIAAAQPEAALRKGEVDAVVEAGEGAAAALEGGGSVSVRIAYDSTEPNSREALDRVRAALDEASKQVLERRLEGAGLDKDFAQPIKVEDQNVAPPEKRAGFVLGTILPMLMIVMLGVGAFYPAIDLTAGEKESGTFETLLSTPVRKTEIVCGKFLAVLSLAVATGLLNLASMTATLALQLSQAGLADGPGGFSLGMVRISPLNVALMVAALIPLALLICAVMMSIAIFARNFKEANNYVAPFFILIVLPGVFAGMPGVELTRATACIPIMNVALMFRELLVGEVGVELMFLVFMSTGACAAAALVAAVWLFQSEQVVLSEEKGIPLSLRRSQFVPRAAPTPGMSMMLFALALLLLFYIGSYLQTRDLISGIFITQWGLFLLPVVALLWYVRVDLRAALNLRRYPWLALPATLLLWFGSAVLINQYAHWQQQYLPPPSGYAEIMGALFRDVGSVGRATLLLLALAVTPAICEEVLFRGAILSGLRTRLSPAWSILLVGVLFGLMHMMVHSVLPTAMLGIAITYVAVRSGSIYPAMLFHLLNNTLAVVNEVVNKAGGPLEHVARVLEAPEGGFAPWLLAAAAVSVALGLWVMEYAAKRRTKAT